MTITMTNRLANAVNMIRLLDTQVKAHGFLRLEKIIRASGSTVIGQSAKRRAEHLWVKCPRREVGRMIGELTAQQIVARIVAVPFCVTDIRRWAEEQVRGCRERASPWRRPSVTTVLKWLHHQPTPSTQRMAFGQTDTCTEPCPAKPDMRCNRMDDLHLLTQSG